MARTTLVTTSDTLTSAATYYVPLGAHGGTASTILAQAQTKWDEVGTFSDLYLDMSSNSGTIEVALNINGVKVSLTTGTLASGILTGSDLNPAHAYTIAANDMVCLQIVVSSGSMFGLRASVQFEKSGQIYRMLTGHASAPFASASTRWWRPVGLMSNQSTETSAQLRALEPCTLSDLQGYCRDTVASSAGVRTRVNGPTNGNQLITFASGVAGFQQDTTNSDSLSVGHTFDLQKDSSATGRQIPTAAVKYAGAVNARSMLAASGQSSTIGAGATVYGALLGGIHLGTVSTTEASVRQRITCPGELSDIWLHVTANASTTNVTAQLVINGTPVPGATLSIAGGATNQFFGPIAGGPWALVAGDQVSIKYSGATSGAVTVDAAQCLFTSDRTATVQLKQGTDVWVDLTEWLDTIPDNEITLTVTGGVGMQAWGFYEEQTNGQTQTWVKRELYEYVKATGAGVSAGATAYWELSALDGPNETGSPSTFVVTFDVLSTPVLTIDTSSRTYAGFGGFPLSRFGAGLNDWVINDQSTADAFAIWDYEAIAWAGAYGDIRNIANPTVGDAAYTVTVSSASRGVSNVTITFNVRSDIIDVRPSLVNDSTVTPPYNQLLKVLQSGDTAGALVWGDTIVSREGTYNPTYASMEVSLKQPTGTAPSSPYGTNAAESWDYADGWNPNWIKVMGDLPLQTRITKIRLQCTLITNRILGLRFTNLDLYKGASDSGATIYLKDSNLYRGLHAVAYDHTAYGAIYDEQQGRSTMQILAYNIWDGELYSYPGLGLALTDSQIIGNTFKNIRGDVFGHFIINSLEGSGKSKFNFNISSNKSWIYNAHADFYQPTASSIHTPYKTTSTGNSVDLGDIVGNLALKGRGYLLDADDIAFRQVYLDSKTVTSSFNIGDTVQNAGATKQMTITTKISDREWGGLITGGVSFSATETVTSSSGGSGTVGYQNGYVFTLTGVTGAFNIGDTVQNTSASKKMVIYSKVDDSHWLAYVIAGSSGFDPSTAITSSSGGSGTVSARSELVYNYLLTSVSGSFAIGDTVQSGGNQSVIISKISNSSWVAYVTSGTNFSANDAVSGPSGSGTITARAPQNTTGGVYSLNGYVTLNTPPTSADIGKTAYSQQVFFANAPSAAPNTGTYKTGVLHKFLMAANIGESEFTNVYANLPVATTGSYLVNNLTTFPWGVNAELGSSGAYYEKGRFNPGAISLIPTGHQAAGSGSLSVRNVFVCANSIVGGAYAQMNNLLGSAYGNPSGTISTVPVNVTSDFTNPVAQSSYTDVRVVINGYKPTVGSQLRSQGTTEIFGPMDTGMVDFRRHTYDKARLTTY